MFTGGKITIDVNKEAYFCGEMIEGTVFVDQAEPYRAKKLQVSFIGSEHTFWDASTDKNRRHFRKDTVLTRVDLTLVDLVDEGYNCRLGKF